VKRIYSILLILMLVCIGCQWQLRPNDADEDAHTTGIQRYDRIENLYLTTGDFSALQQMNTSYPIQTRMLIEDVLHLGKVNDADINTKFLYFFQDSTLQQMLHDVQQQYADMTDVAKELSEAVKRLHEEFPKLELPNVYTQIGSFDQSIIVGAGTLGISLDKYLGKDYPFYKAHYTEEQRQMMVRSMIVPDCLAFYILSQYPLDKKKRESQSERNWHMGKIQWIVNRLTNRNVFENDHVKAVERYMANLSATTFDQLLKADIATD